MVLAEHGRPAVGGLLDLPWTGRRAHEFDEGCMRG
jgi:hypothetical protein